MKRLAVILLCALTACTSPEREAENAVRDILKDPNSAEFKNLIVRTFEGKPAVCGEVNAKNTFGAFVGFKPFMYLPSSQEAYTLPMKKPATNAARYMEAHAVVCGGITEKDYDVLASQTSPIRAKIARLELDLQDAERRLSYLSYSDYEARDEQERKVSLLKHELELARIDYALILPGGYPFIEE